MLKRVVMLIDSQQVGWIVVSLTMQVSFSFFFFLLKGFLWGAYNSEVFITPHVDMELFPNIWSFLRYAPALWELCPLWAERFASVVETRLAVAFETYGLLPHRHTNPGTRSGSSGAQALPWASTATLRPAPMPACFHLQNVLDCNYGTGIFTWGWLEIFLKKTLPL